MVSATATTSATTRELSPARRWSMLGLGMGAQAAGTVFVNAPAFLIPTLHDERGLSLARAGLLVGMPTLGMMLTLILWGALVDRVGERWVLAGGLLLTALAGLGAVMAGSLVATGAFLLLGGMAAASANAASGRVVVGWFPPEKRGFAMGIRQMAQPIGVGVAALTIPLLAAHEGLNTALIVPTILTAVVGVVCAIAVIDPPRPSRKQADSSQLANPYRQSDLLWRIHGVSILLVIPQFTVWNFALVWLISRHGMSETTAGLVIVVSQILGAIGRMAVGILSDRIGSRMRPLRTISVAAICSMLLLGLTDWTGSWIAVVVMLVASVITVADNGLAFTSVAEIGGPFWGGRAMGMQNTGQFLAAAVVPSVIGGLIGWVGYPLTFALVSIFPAIATPLVPKVDRIEPPAAPVLVPGPEPKVA
ncbi:MAG TPA: MFS transporter [Thermomicrobiales bacterium]|nr:MFS transporter [Thermomicrobiales bacterium]